MDLRIRKAEVSDYKNLAVLKQQVWISTYATEGLVEEFSDYVLTEYSQEKVRESILDEQKVILLATLDGKLVGCSEIAITPEQPMSEINPCHEITTLYVLERFQGRGVGKKLLLDSFKQIKALGGEKTWLTVYHENENAIAFYRRLKFDHIGDTNFQLGDGLYRNLIMLKRIE
ncbi:GNAT family N-acetyltransferase [Puteibacter caeruleilacunae]|nr:GNAT family N-acetyltransferase [Puteibacter caeruleilacunae]